MLRLYHHCDAERMQGIHQRIGYLGCQLFLNLQTPREDIDNARHFG